MYDAPSDPALRLAACLAHTVPGVSLSLTCRHGGEVLVSYACLGAQLDPCQLRAGLLCPGVPGVPRLADVVVRVDVANGLLDLGGGLYERSHPGAASERWFVTSLDHEHVVDLLRTGPTDLPDDAMAVTVKPDVGLGVCAVCIRCDDRLNQDRLDEVALWALSTCMVAELLAELPQHS